MDNSLVLVVEDDQSIREMIQVMLEDSFGVQTVPAEDGRQALQILAESMPVLVLLDIMLPGVDGFEVAKQLRASPATRHIPIIAVTASTSPEKAIACGCTDYIQKPFDLDLFLTKVRRHLLGQVQMAHC